MSSHATRRFFNMIHRDCLHRFLFENLSIRGEIAHLDAAWRTVLERRTYPPAIRQVLGEAVAAAALLSCTIKFAGLLTLQIQASGPLRLVVAQVAADRTLRGLARWDGEPTSGVLHELCGDGTLVLTINPGQGQNPYQGMVSLHGDSLAEALEEYFARSEQLPTRIQLVADECTAAGLLLQQIPGVIDPDAWNRLESLVAMLQPVELLKLDTSPLLRRLFPEEDMRLFSPVDFSYRCACSRERTAAMLRALGEQELRQMLAERELIHVDCDFCGQCYQFDPFDIAGLWADTAPASSATHH